MQDKRKVALYCRTARMDDFAIENHNQHYKLTQKNLVFPSVLPMKKIVKEDFSLIDRRSIG